jgi:hypothetical protein
MQISSKAPSSMSCTLMKKDQRKVPLRLAKVELVVNEQAGYTIGWQCNVTQMAGKQTCDSGLIASWGCASLFACHVKESSLYHSVAGVVGDRVESGEGHSNPSASVWLMCTVCRAQLEFESTGL